MGTAEAISSSVARADCAWTGARNAISGREAAVANDARTGNCEAEAISSLVALVDRTHKRGRLATDRELSESCPVARLLCCTYAVSLRSNLITFKSFDSQWSVSRASRFLAERSKVATSALRVDL